MTLLVKLKKQKQYRLPIWRDKIDISHSTESLYIVYIDTNVTIDEKMCVL